MTAWFHTDAIGFERALHGIFNVSRRHLGPRWREQVVVLSAAPAHFHCTVESALGVTEPALGPKPGQHNYPLLNSIAKRLTANAGVHPTS